MRPVFGSGGLLALDGQGRVHAERDAEPTSPEALARAFGALVCAELGVIGARTVDTPSGCLAIITLRERSGPLLELWAGTALREGRDIALRDAAVDALLAPWHHSAIVAGTARLVADGACRAAMVIDDAGVTSYGPPTEFPPLGARGMEPEAGDRLVARTTRGEFHALWLGAASVMLSVVPGPQNGRRIELWFDTLEAALVEPF
jgi:hypothetical protein